MSSSVYRIIIFLVILIVSPIFVTSGYAGHDRSGGLSSLSRQHLRCFDSHDAGRYRGQYWSWCEKHDKPAPSRCHKLMEDAFHYHMRQCAAGGSILPWSKIYADVRQKYLNEKGTRTSKPVPKRRKTTSTNIPLDSKRTIRSIQSRLSKLGYSPGPIDGKMGSRTKAAIKSYQRRHRLSVTGRPNRQLLAALKITSSAMPPRSSRRSTSAGGTKRRTATSSAIDSSFATNCLQADRTNSYLNSCRYTVTEKTLTKAPGGGWIVMGHQSIAPGRRGGLLMQEYRGRYYYMGCRTSDIDARKRNRCVQVWFCLQNLYKRRVAMPSAESLLGRCGVSLNVTKGR